MRFPLQQTLRMQLCIAASSCALIGCAHVAPHARVSDTATPAAVKPAPASFVSPYSYEWFVHAELLAARGQYAAAAEAYGMALSSADDDAYLMARLAEALDLAGDRAAAERQLQAGLELDPRAEAVWLELGKIAARHAELEPALHAFERAESAAPSSPEAPLALAELLQAHGHVERALAVLGRFAERSEQGSLPWLRARLELARARNDGTALAIAASAWLDHAGGHSELLQKLARELLARGQAVLAARVLSTLPPEACDPKLLLEAQLEAMRRDEVELLLRTTPPDALGGPLAIAEAYLRIGKPQRALAALQEQSPAVEDEPQRRRLLEGLALLGSGQAARAALSLASVPKGSEYYLRAALGLRQALEAAGLPALAHEIEAMRP
jgi:thioredoxin-like negative regulator of GroEL